MLRNLLRIKYIIIIQLVVFSSCNTHYDLTKQELALFYNEGDTFKLENGTDTFVFAVTSRQIYYSKIYDGIGNQSHQHCHVEFKNIETNETGHIGGSKSGSGLHSFLCGIGISFSEKINMNNANYEKLEKYESNGITYYDIHFLYSDDNINKAYLNASHKLFRIESDTSDIVYRYVE